MKQLLANAIGVRIVLSFSFCHSVIPDQIPLALFVVTLYSSVANRSEHGTSVTLVFNSTESASLCLRSTFVHLSFSRTVWSGWHSMETWARLLLCICLYYGSENCFQFFGWGRLCYFQYCFTLLFMRFHSLFFYFMCRTGCLFQETVKFISKCSISGFFGVLQCST